ncbi:MAG TPA: nucleotide sugar dehydrogenase [Longimicrobiales bacterium]|nr:nucleotide sugar dehydrogenase [Longimicrobiales bacterium]
MTSEINLSDAGRGLLDRIESRDALVGVVGLGYVGLPLSVELAKAGYRVLGFDVSQSVVDGINAGESHVGDVGDEVLGPLVRQGMLAATTDSSRMAECDVLSICVPTPLSKTRDPDVSFVVSATDAVRRTLRKGQLVLLESTTYPGTTRELVLPALEDEALKVGRDFFLCFSPERVDPGNPVWHVKNTPKVVGGITPQCLTMGVALYSRVMDTVVPVTSTEAAEMTKILENTFRSINIALVNEMAQVADRLNVDVWEVIEAAATKPFGFMKFLPGPGIGGHCIPLDPHYLAWKMKTLNYRTRMIEIASEISAEMPRYVTNKVQDALNSHSKSVKGSRILVLGVAYKRDVDDVRESPALDVMRLLEEKEANVVYHDPFVKEFTEDGHAHSSVDLTDAEIRKADCVAILTDHRGIDYQRVVRLARVVVDTRNATAGYGAANVVGLSGPRRALSLEEAPRVEAIPA